MKYLITPTALLFFSLSIFGQTANDSQNAIDKQAVKKYDPSADPRNFTVSHVEMTWDQIVEEPNGCRMKEGVLRCYKNNIVMPIDRHMLLDNGTLAFMNGTVITRKGEIIHLKNGNCIDLYNAVVECPKKKQ